jgi:hypothetical protein
LWIGFCLEVNNFEFFRFFFKKSKQKIENKAETLPVNESWACSSQDSTNLHINIPAFASSINLIRSVMAMILVKLYKSEESEEGKVTSKIFDDQRVSLLMRFFLKTKNFQALHIQFFHIGKT